MKKDEEIKEEIETLDFDSDEEVSNIIDEMLDFVDTSEPTEVLSYNKELDELLQNTDKEESNKKIEIDASKEKLDDYKPSIKYFNIKSAKTRKIVHKAMLYVIIIMLLGFEFFINKTGDVLDDLRVYASDNQPIRITQNEKYGYIDYLGRKIVNPKYTYGENFIKGYAIVKNSSDLPLIIDKGGKEAIPSGNYFSIYRAGTDIVASKVTKKGLKYGILNEDIKEKTEFKYDSITYLDIIYTYVYNNVVGIINSDGKEIYNYKLNDSDDKIIEVAISSVTNDKYQRYGVAKVNSSSQIVNLSSGKIVTSPTLNEIIPKENNVFYELLPNGNKRFIYIQDDKVLVESEGYISLSISSIESGVLKAIDTSYKYEFISTKTLEQLKKGLTQDDVYEGEGIFIYKAYNYKKNKNEIVLVKSGEIFKTLDEDFTIYKGFKNGIAIVKFSDDTYGYLNEEGNFISEEHYLEALEFDSYGDAIAKKDSGYGIINNKGKVIIDFDNKEIKMASSEVKKKNVVENKNIFYAVKKDNKYALYNSKGKRVDKEYYDDVIFDDNYGIVKVSTDINDSLIISNNMSKLNLTSFNTNYEAYDNYIIIKNDYYNYEGKIIYVNNSESDGDNSE